MSTLAGLTLIWMSCSKSDEDSAATPTDSPSVELDSEAPGETGGDSRAGGDSAPGEDSESPSSGLDVRPTNLSCLAPERPASSAEVQLTPVNDGLRFTYPVSLKYGEGRWFVAQQGGLLMSFEDGDEVSSAVTTLDLSGVVSVHSEAGLLDVALHPEFGSNGWIYTSHNVQERGQLKSRISRFTSSDGGVTADPASEQIIYEIAQPYTNHNGGAIHFGPDGMLYFGLGDGGSAGDPLGAGQDVTTALGTLIRLDVDGGDPYAIPADNPFAGGGGAPEIYAWGLRNPWRFSFDPETGELWVGDVGQYDWEEISLVERGGNYGWNYKEGTHCYSVTPCDMGDLIDPVVEYPNPRYASVVMGPVYRGSAIPSLVGSPLFADFYSGVISRIVWDEVSGEAEIEELVTAAGSYLSSITPGPDGEVKVMDYYSGRLYRLEAAGEPVKSSFPTLLSETGCMDSEDLSQPGEGLIPYGVNMQLWSDGAEKERWLALPEGSQIQIKEDGDWDLPVGSVVVKQFRMEGSLLETRLMVRHEDGEWAGYTYAWNEEQTEATFAPAGTTLERGDLRWTTPSSADCLACHTEAAGRTLGLETAQLNGELTYPGGATENQLAVLSRIGLFDEAPLEEGGDPSLLPALPALDSADRDGAARSYLHVNCGSCHREGAPGGGDADLRFTVAEADLGICGSEPLYGDMGLEDVLVLAPGEPDRSLLSLRMERTDVHRMPPLATEQVHAEGVSAVRDWIEGMEGCP